jgi:hypothetical protein
MSLTGDTERESIKDKMDIDNIVNKYYGSSNFGRDQ